MKRPLFPSWTDKLVPLAGLLSVGGVVYAVVLILAATAPNTTSTGYMPTQPVPYSHALHAGELGIDCRYCHTGVETGAKATIPPTQTCMNCHANVRKDSELLQPVRDSYESGMPIEWVRVHDLPDFVYFDHSAHVTRGVSCVSCHGRVDQMEVVYQAEPLNMGWCLSCHRQPDANLRPRQFVTDLGWQPDEDPAQLGARLREELGINPSTDCSTCHR
jgi:hypothetical protein